MQDFKAKIISVLPVGDSFPTFMPEVSAGTECVQQPTAQGEP